MNVETNFTRHADALDDSFELEAAQKKRRNIIIAVILAVIILGVLAMRFSGGSSFSPPFRCARKTQAYDDT